MGKYYKSKLLSERSIIHGFGTRHLDINMALEEIPEGEILVPKTKQIHSSEVLYVKRPLEACYIGDAFITDEKGILLLVRTADCLPLLLFEEEARIISAVHCGWRGTARHIVRNTLAKIVAMGGKASKIVAAIGPHIREEVYEVGDDVLNSFINEGWREDALFARRNGKIFLSLKNAVVYELTSGGVGEKNIDLLTLSTYENPEFFSYRRTKSKEGRMINFILL